MTITPDDEAPRTGGGAGFSDAVTFAFGDRAAELYGIARVGLSAGDDGAAQSSGLAVLFSGREPVAARAAGGIPMGERSWDAIDAAGVTTQTIEPLAAWRVSFTGDAGTTGFDLEFRAISEPGELDAEQPAASAGGMVGYEQLCHVTGSVRARGGERRVDCLGQRGHSWGEPDWDRIDLARTVTAWVGDDLGVSLTAIRGAKAKSHADEAIGATVFAVPADDIAADALAIATTIVEPRLSTTVDSEGRQRKAGLELYPHEDAYPHRGAGSVLCGTSLDLGRLRLDCAFFEWHVDGRTGVGRYDVLRKVPA